jgi:uncharacterized protein VirK/YbjX
MSGAINFVVARENFATLTSRPTPAPRYIVERGRLPVSAARVCVWTWRAFTHIGAVRNVLGLLAKIPPYSAMVQNDPRFSYKFLTDDYLARGFSTSDRASCFIHHYSRLRELLPGQLLRQILQDEITLHEFPGGGDRFAVTMGLSRPYDNEGELTLRLRVDGDIVFVLSFTMVPGSVVESPAAEALLITRLQGVKGCYRQIGDATKALYDVAPAQILLAALQGVASAFDIRAIAAIPAERQSSFKKEAARAFKDSYDNLFSAVGLSKSETGFFSSAVPIDQKPLTSIKRGHKLRTREKRAFKQRIQSACAAFLQECVRFYSARAS